MNKRVVAYAVRGGEYNDSQEYEIIDYARSPQEAADLVVGGWYTREANRSRTITAYVAPVHVGLCHGQVIDESAEDQYHVYIPPEDLDDCTGDWRSPHAVVGGIKENPGVWGHGGGVVIREVCACCGRYRITDTWDTSSEGEPITSVHYEQADDISLEWLESL